MHTSRFHNISARFSPSKLRTSFRRSSSASSSSVESYKSNDSAASSPVSTINSIIFRQPSMMNLEEERQSFGSELTLLEPRPIVYWGSVEERMGSLNF